MPRDWVYATTGSDITGNGTVGTPYATPKKCGEMASPGDSVVGRGGTYEIATGGETTYWANIASGSSGAVIPYKPYTAETVKWECATGRAHMIYLTEKNYLTFEDMEWDGLDIPTSHLVRVNDCDHLTFDTLNAHSGGIIFYIGSLVGNSAVRSNHVMVKDSQIHDSFNSHGFYIDHCADFVLNNCDIYNTYRQGIQVTTAWSGHTGWSDRAIISNNRFFNTNQELGVSNPIIIGNGDSTQVYNNIIYKNLGSGPDKYGIILAFDAGTLTNCSILHNTIHEISTNGYGIYIGKGSGHTVKNNLISVGGTAIADPGSRATVSNNLTSFTPADVWVDPSNATLASRDYHLKTGSAAIDLYVSVGVAIDKYGTIRPQGSGGLYDAGATEFIDDPPAAPATPGISVALTQTVVPGELHDLNADANDQDGNIVYGYVLCGGGNAGFDFDPSGCTVTHKTS